MRQSDRHVLKLTSHKDGHISVGQKTLKTEIMTSRNTLA